MVKTAKFFDRDPVHLINGYLVRKTTLHDPYLTADELCERALEKAIPPGWHARSAKPVRLPPDSKPEPGRSVVRRQIRDYSTRSPGPADTVLVEAEKRVRALCSGQTSQKSALTRFTSGRNEAQKRSDPFFFGGPDSAKGQSETSIPDARTWSTPTALKQSL
jgi:hypothetical protein